MLADVSRDDAVAATELVEPIDDVLRAQTTFVCIELSSGKPKRMPAEFIEGYGPALTGG